MYRTNEVFGPPAGQPRSAVFPLGLARVVHRRFDSGTTRIDDDDAVRHLTDLTNLYGVTYREDIARRSTGNTFTGMAGELIDAMSSPDEPIDLVVIAHATPDLDNRLAATTYLSHVLPDASLVFAVSEGGTCTPYTALRLAGTYAERHGYQRALVLLMDQATLPYDTGTTLSGDAAIGLLLQRQCPTGLVLRQVTGVTPATVAEAFEDVLSMVAGPDEPVAVIAGAGVDPDRDLPGRAEAVWYAPMGYPCTATWEGLARHLGAGTGGRVVLIDYEPDTGDLSVCAVDQPWLASAARGAA